MPRLTTFILYPLSFILLASCDSASLNQSNANPFVILAAQFAEGSVTTSPTTHPAPTPSYQPHTTSPSNPVASPQHPPLISAAPPANLTTPW